jgi:transposase-like protein
MIVQVESVQQGGNTVSKRRTFTSEFKARAVLEELTGVKDEAEICREYRLRPQVFSRGERSFWNEPPRSLPHSPVGAGRPGHRLRVHVRGAADRRHPARRHRAT